jgi:hypothetical protein
MSKIETLKATRGAGKREIYIVGSLARLDQPDHATINPAKGPMDTRKRRCLRFLHG